MSAKIIKDNVVGGGDWLWGDCWRENILSVWKSHGYNKTSSIVMIIATLEDSTGKAGGAHWEVHSQWGRELSFLARKVWKDGIPELNVVLGLGELKNFEFPGASTVRNQSSWSNWFMMTYIY